MLNIFHLWGMWDYGAVPTGEEQPGGRVLKQHLHMGLLHQGTVTLSSCARGDFICIDKSEIKFGKPIHITGRRISLWKATCKESLWPSDQSTKPHGPSLESSRWEKAAVWLHVGRVTGSATHSFPLNTHTLTDIWAQEGAYVKLMMKKWKHLKMLFWGLRNLNKWAY